MSEQQRGGSNNSSLKIFLVMAVIFVPIGAIAFALGFGSFSGHSNFPNVLGATRGRFANVTDPAVKQVATQLELHIDGCSAVAKNLDAINEISNTVGGLVLFAKSLSGDVTFTADEIKVMEAQEEAINDLIVELNDLAAQCNGTAPTKEQEEKARKTWADLKTKLKAFMDGEVIQKLQAPLGANRIDENFDSPASSVGVGYGGVPSLSQGSYRNLSFEARQGSRYRFSGTTISSSGCSVVSTAMVLMYYGIQANNADALVRELRDFAVQNNYRGSVDSGVSNGFFPAVAKKYGLTWVAGGRTSLSKKKEEIVGYLQDKKPVIVSGRSAKGVGWRVKTPFTGGHFVVLADYRESDNSVGVNDPNGARNKRYDMDVLLKDAHSYWVMTK